MLLVWEKNTYAILDFSSIFKNGFLKIWCFWFMVGSCFLRAKRFFYEITTCGMKKFFCFVRFVKRNIFLITSKWLINSIWRIFMKLIFNRMIKKWLLVEIMQIEKVYLIFNHLNFHRVSWLKLRPKCIKFNLKSWTWNSRQR
jgi:hypothetical protein